MPNRIIKESICESRGLSEVSFFASDLYKRLITYADDYGRFNADYQILRARLYPREIEIVSIGDIDDALTELIGAGKVVFYTTKYKKEIYGALPNWNEHQRVRDSKAKTPDISDTEVNDWYYRRHISLDMKAAILERDKFKCTICGKYICPPGTNAKRFVKMGTGLFHIDHIVPVNQGGRATYENLRLTCPECNLKRKRFYSYDEIIEMAEKEKSEDLQGAAASCGELRRVAASCGLNPIQSESESNPNTSVTTRAKSFIPPSVEEVAAYCQERDNGIDAQRFVTYYEARGWMLGKTKMKDWRAAVRTWERGSGKKDTSGGFYTDSVKDNDVAAFMEG